MVLQIVVVIDGPKPLYIDALSLGILLKLVPHSKSTFPMNIAFDIDIILSLTSLINPTLLILVSRYIPRHFLMPLMHGLQQLLGHVSHVVEGD